MPPDLQPPFVVCALYKFVRLENFETLRTALLELMLSENIRGTLLLASEGINGTVAGTRAGVSRLLDHLHADARLNPLETKESFVSQLPFNRAKVKLKKEIVTMGVEGIDPNQSAGTYVRPEDWNALIADPDVLLIDTRNDYEVEIGSFRNAVNPNTGSFREFPEYANKHLDPHTHKKVAMFCTGGIRCEKSTAYLKQQGFDEVYHLQGGILKYLETVPEHQSQWEGECFVFDERVAVNHQLCKGSYDQCHACRYPITHQDMEHEHYQQGISCPRCYTTLTERQRARFAEREKQVQLSNQRGESHLGTDAANTLSARKDEKRKRHEQSREGNGSPG